MKPQYIFLTAVICIASNVTGYDLASYNIVHKRQPIEIANGCAYYDMDSGDFTWGVRPVVMSAGIPTSESAPDPFPMPKISSHKKVIR